MTLHRSALFFYLPFPAFYCSTLSPFHSSEVHYTFLSFHLITIRKPTIHFYPFTFQLFKKPLQFLTFLLSHRSKAHFSLLTPHLSTFKQPHLIGHPLLWRGLGRPPSFGVKVALFWCRGHHFYNLISLNEVPDINLSRSTCPFMPRTFPRSVNCHMLCLPAPFISGRRELYFPRKRKYVLKRGARCEL